MSATEPWLSPPALADREFRLFAALVYEQAGIRLTDGKRALLAGRLTRRLRALGCTSFAEYYAQVTSDPQGELVTMLDCICTNETQFFREPAHFTFLRERLCPMWRAHADRGARPRAVRAWSAGCSTGEEPYSIAMVLLDELPAAHGWDVRVVGTDLSTKALAHADAGLYRLERTRHIPPTCLRRFMLRGIGRMAGMARVSDELRSAVDILRGNLHAGASPVVGQFDLVFCRNVLIYFDAGSRLAAARRLVAHLKPEGCLFVGHAETLSDTGLGLRSVIPTVYSQSGSAGAQARR